MTRRLTIPRRLTVRGRRWRVRRTRALARGLTGECVFAKRELKVRRGLSQRETELTLCHEWLHGVWPDEVVSDEIEERIVRRLEGPLRRLLLSGQIVGVEEEAD